MEIKPEYYVKKLKEISAKYSDADLFMEPFRTVTAQLISGQASIGLLDSGERDTLNLEAKVEERVEVE